MEKLIAILTMILIPSLAFGAVTVVNTKDIDGTKQWVYIQLTVDGDTCRYVTVQPWNTNTPVLSGQNLTDWVNSREDRYNVEILKRMYPNARYFINNGGERILTAFTQWITDGHTNAAYCSDAQYATEQDCTDNGKRWKPQEVIDKIPFQNSWQPVKVNAEKNMKTSALHDKTDAQIDTYIDNIIIDMASAKEFLKKLTRQVRNIVRRQGWSNN